ncbi:MAG TPA: isoprenylcysteine carboxylmethyltransferase family protein [Verrucomicrobiae bacterium]|nr:isoprenylcysteine carboxylmethyltransferase family protein [Verrucomicrobiae bacterium]
MPKIPGLIILSCWLFFLLYWLISWFGVKATAERKSFVSSLPYRTTLIVGGYVLGKFGWQRPMNLPLTPHTFWSEWIGAGACLAGLAIAIWSRWTLAGNWSSDVRFKQGHELVQTGPYRFVRHPIYTGLLIMCLAVAIQFGRLHQWLGVLIIGIGLWIKLKQEETIMLQHFSDYAAYRKRVRALVPFVF